MVKEAGLAARLFYDDHERRSGLVRFLAPDATPEAFATAAATELGDLRDGDFAIDHLARGQVSLSRDGTVARPAGDGRQDDPPRRRPAGDPSSSIDVELHHRGTRPIDARLGLELSVHLLGGGGNPSAWYDVGGARIGPRPERPGRRASTRSATATTGSASRCAATARAGRRRLVEPDRDRLELGVRLRARLPGQRPAVLVAAAARARARPAGSRSPGGQRRARPRGRGGAGARVSRVPGRPAVTRGRLVVHAHFYQPSRVDPFTGRVPASRRPRRSTTGTRGSTPSATGRTPSAATSPRSRWNLGPDARRVAGAAAPDGLRAVRRRPTRGGGTGIAQAFHHTILPLASARRPADGDPWGIRDFELRFGRRPAGDVAARDGGGPGDAAALAEAGHRGTRSSRRGRRTSRTSTPGGRTASSRRRPPRSRSCFYDGGLSGAVSFEPAATADADRFARERVAPRLARRAAPAATTPAAALVIATDGELYGHHQRSATCSSQRLVAPETAAPDRGFDVVDLADAVAEPDGRPHPEIRIRERTSWSCHHGVAALDRRVPGRARRPLEGARCGRRWSGSPGRSTRSPSQLVARPARAWATLGGARRVRRRGRRGRRRRRLRGGAAGPAGRRRPTVAGCSSCSRPSAGDWRCSPATAGSGTTRPARDAAGPAVRGACGAARRPARGDRPRDAARRRPRDAPSPSRGVDGGAIYRLALSEVGQPPPRADRGMRRSSAWRANAPGP